jgi:hypothetical protein
VALEILSLGWNVDSPEYELLVHGNFGQRKWDSGNEFSLGRDCRKLAKDC